MPRDRGRQPEHENHDRWLVSYADFITLLFAFFVVMFATAQTDKSKAQQVSDSVKKALAGQPMSRVVSAILGPGPNAKPRVEHAGKNPRIQESENPRMPTGPEHLADLLPFEMILRKELEEEIKSGRVQLSMGPRGLTISFRQAALFPSGEDVIAPDAYPSIQKIARAMTQIPNPARLEGHTDSIPIHNSRFRSNWELSAARSIALLELLTKRFEVPAVKISIAGYAETAPIADNGTDDGRTRNRRADIVILNETGLKGEPERTNSRIPEF
jgi:chemotaxis protein MotB